MDPVPEEDRIKQRILELKALQEQLEKDLDALGDKIGREIVVPVCAKYKLAFVTIQGNFWFMKKKYTKNQNDWHNAPRYGDSEELSDPIDADYDDISDAAKEALRPILDLLNMEVSHNQFLGYYVDEVK